MKIFLPTRDQRRSVSECRTATSGLVLARQNSTLLPARSSRGIALVVTLIMLSIITFLAVAFLALSNRNRKAAGVAADQTDSRLMAQTAEARAQSVLVARMMSSNSLYAFDLTVTTNYLNPAGFNSINSTNLTNVNYNYNSTGKALNNDEHIQNIANLFYDPRPPVYINTNTRSKSVSNDFRYYLDLNRNGIYETNGFLPVYDRNGVQIVDPTTNGNVPRMDSFVGDPEWIGILEKPELPHSPTNRFIGRYAYVVLPVGKTLDLNYIHNQAKRPAGDGSEGFYRNQGFGSWEINFAAFLRDLNTNFWAIATYETNLANNSQGPAYTFDAVGLLRHRYNNGTTRSYRNLASVEDVYRTNSVVFTNDLIDGYADGPLMTLSALTTDNDQTNAPWSGSRNPTRFYDMQELFGTNMNQTFTNRFQGANDPTNKSSYDRYTFYRMLQQMGTDSAPELKGKINLNYTNDLTQNFTATNWIPWSAATNGALRFFTNVAQRLIETHIDKSNPTNWIFDNQFVGTNFAFTNIQLFPTNFYTATTHRLLQVAANIYDAVNTNKSGTNFPSIFRPTFTRTNITGTNYIYITGYLEETNSAFLTNSWYDLGQLAFTNPLPPLTNINIYGQAIVVGAKKGFPNFNRMAIQSQVYAERKLEFRRPNRSSPVNETNQMFILSITNLYGVEAWNSYKNVNSGFSKQRFYPRPLFLRGDIQSEMVLTNETGQMVWPTNNAPFRTNFVFSKFYGNNNLWTNDTYFAAVTNHIFLTNSIYVHNSGNPFFRPITSDPRFERNAGFPDMQLFLVMTNRLRYFLTDGTNVVDFVNITNSSALNIISNLVGEANFVPQGPALTDGDFWRTNRPNGSTSITDPTMGVMNQIMVNTNGHYPNSTASEVNGFNYFLFGKDTNLVHQAPYSPKRQFRDTKFWAANDPLVHYMLSDLIDGVATNNVTYDLTRISLGTNDNDRYMPWGGNPFKGNANDTNKFELAIKDPGIWGSDSWEFPTNKFPNIGWIGRVHRGTPWQTIYLKSTIADTNAWKKMAGSYGTHPTNDWRFLDLFTVAPNDNAARGLLSVNQTNIAAWSAVLSGVLTMSNSSSGTLNKFTVPQFTAVDVKPNSFELTQIVGELNEIRKRKANGLFRSVGEILESTNLTVSSRFLSTANTAQKNFGLTDAAYERIPQQVLSLLKLGEPRFVIYAFGQSLKPAENSIVLNPGIGKNYLFNLCTNYQITGEVLTRTVMRVEGKPDRPKTVIESYNIMPGPSN